MKIAISVPDDIARAVDAKADDLGTTRSDMYATAARRYLAQLQAMDDTARVNAIAEELGGIDPESAWVIDSGHRVLEQTEWDES